MTEEEKNNELESEAFDIDDIEELKKALAEEKEKAENYLASWQRAQADFINSKRRNEHEMEERRKFANSGLLLGILPVFDDLERALASVPPGISEESWVDGIRLISNKALAELEIQGLLPIQAIGEPFDPNLHEAIREDNGKEGIVIEEIQRGYIFHDRILRPSRVVVGNGKVKNENNTEDRTAE
ncbi:nucleotide exchange factor GrpE [Chloroflexota bacterium]